MEKLRVVIQKPTGAVGGGEANTTSSVGTGEDLTLPKAGINLPFKSLKATGDATISSDGDSVTIDVQSSVPTDVMTKSVYDTNDNGIVDDAEKVNGKTVETSVPAIAVFTDTQITPVAGSNITVDNSDPLNPIFSAIPGSSAGQSAATFFTGDNVVVGGVTFFSSSRDSKGAAPSVTQTLTLNDGQKAFYPKDLISEPFPIDVDISKGRYVGNLTLESDSNQARQEFGIEAYRCLNDGTPISAGNGEVTGDLGVDPIAYLSTGVIDITANRPLSLTYFGFTKAEMVLLAGERVRYHVFARKDGTNGGAIDYTVYYGNSFNSFIEVPIKVNTDTVVNKSEKIGATSTDVMNGGISHGALYSDTITNKKNYLYRDGLWLGVPLVDTIERLAPISVSKDIESIPLDGYSTGSDVSVVKMVHHYTLTKDIEANSFQVRVPNWDLDTRTRVTVVNITQGTSDIFDNKTLELDGYNTLKIGNTLFAKGDVIDVILEVYNTIDANSIKGGWKADETTADPTLSSLSLDDLSTPTIAKLQHTDLDGTGRATELDGVVSGSIITVTETSNPDRTIRFEVDAVDTLGADFTAYTVLAGSIENGSRDVRDGRTLTINIDVPIAVATDYDVITDEYLSGGNVTWATITSNIYYGGVIQPSTTDGYGIRIVAQEISVSSDWLRYAVSGNGGIAQPTKTPTVVDFSGAYTIPNGSSDVTFLLDNAINQNIKITTTSFSKVGAFAEAGRVGVGFPNIVADIGVVFNNGDPTNVATKDFEVKGMRRINDVAGDVVIQLY